MYIINDNLTESAALAAFESATSGTTTVTLNGDNFQSSGMHVYFSYYGAQLDLPITYLTSAAIQVQLPNKVLLLPGVGRFTITAPNTASGNAPSNSLDFTVQYPVPDLVKAGPSMWASDPRFLDATLSVVGDNFLDIPDYYQYNEDVNPQTGLHPHRLLQYFWSVSSYTPAMPQFFPQFNFNTVAPLPTVNWNGQQLPLFVEPDPSGLAPSLLPNALFATSNLATVSIVNPGPGGGTCPVPVKVLIGATHPQIVSLKPNGAQPGDPDLRLVVKGQSDFPNEYYDPTDPNQPVAHGFEVGSVVNWNGIPLATTFVSATELHADVPTADLATGAVNQITVTSPVVNKDGTTNVYTSPQTAFTVANPVPTLASAYPNLVITANPGTQTGQNAPASNLTLKGTGFVPNSKVYWSGTALTTTFVSATVLDAIVPATLVAQAGTATITVVNPAPGGGSSATAAPSIRRGQALVPQAAPTPVTITIQNATPGSDNFHLQVTQVAPSPIAPGSGNTTILVQGSGFFSGSVVKWNGTPLSTTFQSWHALEAVVPAADLKAAGSASITVVNPNSSTTATPDGGTSNALTVSVASPPVLVGLSLNPAAIVGGNIVTGTVTINTIAPAGGVAVPVSSSNPAAMVPAVTVPAGATSVPFTIMTDAVTGTTPVTITAGSGSATFTASLYLYTPSGLPAEHVLWKNANGTTSIWTLNQAGTYIHHEFGPYAGWTAKAIADGPDGRTHVLWTNTNGAAALWNLDNSTGQFTYASYGPFTGFAAVSLSVGGDGNPHLLWDKTDGTAVLWTINHTTGSYTFTSYGPFPGWTAKALASGATVTDLLWTKTDGTMCGYRIAANGSLTYHTFGPFTGYTATALSVGPDDGAHPLWDSANGSAALWSADFTSGAFTFGSFGPFSGWSAAGVATGADNITHLLWDNTTGQISLWSVTGSGHTHAEYGPFAGWTAVGIATP